MIKDNGGRLAILEWWRPVAIASLAVNITLVGCWASIGRHMLTKEEIHKHIKESISSIQCRWQEDRGQVFSHLKDREIHEGDRAKRQRIREEIELIIATLRDRQQEILSRVKSIETLMASHARNLP